MDPKAAQEAAEAEELQRRVDEFFANGGREQLELALARARIASAEVMNNMRVDFDSLFKPMTL